VSVNFRQAQIDLAGERELESLAHEVQDDLLPDLVINLSLLARVERRTIHPQAQAAFSQVTGNCWQVPP
jgi:hypothetical protein